MFCNTLYTSNHMRIFKREEQMNTTCKVGLILLILGPLYYVLSITILFTAYEYSNIVIAWISVFLYWLGIIFIPVGLIFAIIGVIISQKEQNQDIIKKF